MSINYRQKAKDLINLGTDARTPEKERANAIAQAVRLIAEHDLLSSPLDALIGAANNETVRAATNAFSHLANPEFVDSMRKVVSALGSARKAASGGGSRRTSRRR